jgi:hypothetical protein
MPFTLALPLKLDAQTILRAPSPRAAHFVSKEAS